MLHERRLRGLLEGPLRPPPPPPPSPPPSPSCPVLWDTQQRENGDGGSGRLEAATTHRVDHRIRGRD